MADDRWTKEWKRKRQEDMDRLGIKETFPKTPEKAHAASLVTESKRQLGQLPSSVVVSRSVDYNLHMENLSELEEIILDCIVDDLAKIEVLPEPKGHTLIEREVRALERLGDSGGPWRVIGEDDLRAKTGLKLHGKEWAAAFALLMRQVTIKTKFRSLVVDGHYHDFTLQENALLFPKVVVHRWGVASRRKNIPEDSKLKYEWAYQFHGPLSMIIKDGIARGRFGVLPKALYARRVDWPVLRLVRYYDLHSGNREGVKFPHWKVLELLREKQAVDVRHQNDRFDRYFKLAATHCHATLTRFHRGKDALWMMRGVRFFPPKKVNRKKRRIQ